MRIAACGNDCGACPRFTAETEEALLAVARAWQKAGWRESVVAPAEIACAGCGAGRPCRYGIVGCVTERGLGSCAQCGGFACESLRRAFERSAVHRGRCRGALGPEWSAVPEKAFFNKKENPDMLHRERIGDTDDN